MISIPDGVVVEVYGNTVKVKGPKGNIERCFAMNTRVIVEGKTISVQDTTTAGANTASSLVNNMIVGVTKGYEKKLKVVYAHFPIAVEVKGAEMLIKNFQGEKQPRKTVISGGQTKVQVKGQEITVSGPDKEAVGQTAANLKAAARIRKKDPRVFQDGIYVVG